MAESSEREQSDLNTFKESTDSKTVEKEAVNKEKTEDYANAIAASIAFEIDEDIAEIQAEAIAAVANAIKSEVDLGTRETKLSNLEIEAALNSSEGRGSPDATSSSVLDRDSLTKCQLAAYYAVKRAQDARLVILMAEDLMETMSATVTVLKSHIGVFAAKTVEARGRGTERGYNVADFYIAMVSKYEAAIGVLERRFLNVEIALKRVQDCVKECVKYAALAEEVTDETLHDSRRITFEACWWNNKGKASIVVLLKKERAALLMMRRMWTSVRDDMIGEDLDRTVEESDEETQQCENRERKTKIGHIVSTLLGLALLSITSLFKVGSDSFYAILVLGLLTTGWCAVYWSIKLYICLKGNDNQETVTERREEDGYLENCERRLGIIEAQLRKYNVFVSPETESDTGSSEAATASGISW